MFAKKTFCLTDRLQSMEIFSCNYQSEINNFQKKNQRVFKHMGRNTQYYLLEQYVRFNPDAVTWPNCLFLGNTVADIFMWKRRQKHKDSFIYALERLADRYIL